MAEQQENQAEMGAGGEFKELFRAVVVSVVEDRIQKALAGEQEWDALRQYVDRRIVLAAEGEDPRWPGRLS